MKDYTFLPYFNRQQRRGILILLGTIFVLQIIVWQSGNVSGSEVPEYKIPEAIQKQYDSLATLARLKAQKKIYPFNPNYLTDYKGYYLGLSLQQIDSVLAFRKTNHFFKTKEQFKQVAGLSDSLYNVLAPYIKIPVYKKQAARFSSPVSSYDLNLATATDLQQINGIGPVLSKRIVKYRQSIGGFHSPAQLNKVYGLKPETAQAVLAKFYLKTSDEKVTRIKKKAVNSADIDDFKQVPGIGDKLATRIFKYRQKIHGFTIPDQLNEVYGLSPEVRQTFWQYFHIEKPAKVAFKINLNEANIKDLAKNPYISYALAKKIVSYRTYHGAFTLLDSLKQVPDYPVKHHRQICLYLKL